jgi:alpha-amylase
MTKNDTILQCFEWYLPEDGTFWNHVADMAPSFLQEGITCVWLPPAYKGQGGTRDVGYGVYDMYDLGEFDQKGTVRTKYGTKQEYLNAVKVLQKNQLAVICDIVFNHRMGADEKETVTAYEDASDNRTEQISGPEQIETWTRFTFPGRKGKYSSFQWDHTCFDGTDWDDEGKKKSIYLFADKHWDSDVDSEDGNYDYLMGCDLDMSNPAVRKELDDWGRWYLNLVKPQGVRLDAVKHIEFTFFEDWLQLMRKDTNNPDLFAVGEYWNADCGKLLHYLDVNNNCLSLFDVALHFKFYQAANGSGYFDMGSLLNNTIVSERPMNAVTFVDNHDTQPGQGLSSFVMSWFKPLAYAVILLRRDGLPCVFYGDLFGIPHDNVAPTKGLKEMMMARAADAYGDQADYFDHEDIVGWIRMGDAEHPGSGMAVLMSDGPGGEKQMYAGTDHAGETYIDLLGNCSDKIVIGNDGNAVFRCNGGSVSVWMPQASAEKISVSQQRD